MAEKKQQEEESSESAPLWMISFADMASLLMAFFIMLSTFASFGPAESAQLTGIAKNALLPNYGWFEGAPKTAIGMRKKSSMQAEQGSEKPTLEQNSDGRGMAETGPRDFRANKVFLLESKIAFLGQGATLSSEGRNFFDTLASFVGKVKGQIIISETGPGDNIDFGISRAVVVMKYLTNKGISADYCNISAIGVSPAENFQGERMVEIVLLDEGASK